MTQQRLTLDADLAFNDVVRTFIERAAAPAIGGEALADLARAAEESFTYVAEQSPGAAVRFRLDPKRHAAVLDVEFDGVDLEPATFNITRTLDLEDDAMADLPLLLAARSVDRFDLSIQPGETVRIRLQKDRAYADLPPITGPLVTGEGVFTTAPGSAELLRYFTGLIEGVVPTPLIPDFARNGDRLADLVEEDEVAGALATNAEGQIGGGILWSTAAGGKVVAFYGPYVLAESGRAEIATALVEAFIGTVSRGKLDGLFSRHVTDDLPEEYFEPIGTLLPPEGGAPVRAVYRGLHEDHAVAIWADPALIQELEDRFAMFALAREIRPVRQPVAGSAVLSVAFDRAAGSAILSPILAGADAAEVVDAHVALLASERMLLAELDLGRSVDATFIPALLAAGFQTRFVVPSGGLGDVLVMQRPAGG